MSKGIKKIGVLGWEFYKRDEEHQILIFKSGTKEYYHVIIDRATQDNEYFHLTGSQILKKFKITI